MREKEGLAEPLVREGEGRECRGERCQGKNAALLAGVGRESWWAGVNVLWPAGGMRRRATVSATSVMLSSGTPMSTLGTHLDWSSHLSLTGTYMYI